MSDSVLTVSDVVALGAIVNAAHTTAKVARLVENNDVLYGHARSIGDERGAFIRATEDVRGVFLRVTLTSGFEAFWPVREVVAAYKAGEFFIDVTFPR